ncbi:MAG: site-specific integrase [Leptospiraceae bacterium]|jgi:integrase/recombinase XerD|nr:site-specific integrase [Leptospiraceae bacterium]
MELSKTQNREIGLRLFSPNLPKRRGQGTYSKGSLEQMNLVIEKRFIPFLDSHKVNLQNLGEVLEASKQFLNERLETEYYTTVKKEKSILSSWLVLNYQANPKRIELELSEIKIPEMGIDKTEKSKSFQDLKAIIEKIENPKHKLLLKLAYYSGCRVSELIHLRVKDGKPSKDKKEIFFHTIGKGNKARLIRCQLEIYKEIISTFKSKSKANRKGYLFFNPRNKEGKYSRQFIYQLTQDKGDFTPHQLRHSRATHLVEMGTPINEVSELLGHSSIATTTKFYIHSKIKSETLERMTL